MAEDPTKTQNTDRLQRLLEKRGGATIDFFKDAIDEINAEEADKRKDAAKALIRTAKGLNDQMKQTRQRFNSEMKKFDKELGKIMGRLENMARGVPADEGEKEDDEDKGKENED